MRFGWIRGWFGVVAGVFYHFLVVIVLEFLGFVYEAARADRFILFSI